MKVLVVDADEQQRRSLCASLEARLAPREALCFVGVSTLADGQRQLLADRFDYLIFELVLPDGWGDELLSRDGAARVTEVVVYSACEEDAPLRRAVAGGATALIDKADGVEGLLVALAERKQGREGVSPRMVGRLLRLLRRSSSPPPSSVTHRELEVARVLSRGMTNAEAAEFLGISTHTVCTHVKSLYKKLEVNSRAELSRVILLSGWGEDPITMP